MKYEMKRKMAKNKEYQIKKLEEEALKLGVDPAVLATIAIESLDENEKIRKLRSAINKKKPIPEIGTLVTMFSGSDRYGGKVTSHVSNREIIITLDGGSKRIAKRDNKGDYYTGSGKGTRGSPVAIGYADTYYDPSF